MDIRQLKAEARQTLRTGAHRGVTLRFILLSEIPVLFYLAYYFWMNTCGRSPAVLPIRANWPCWPQ